MINKKRREYKLKFYDEFQEEEKIKIIKKKILVLIIWRLVLVFRILQLVYRY